MDVLSLLLTLFALIRVVPSTVPGIIDLQRPTDHGWETYNNIAVLVEANGVWNSSELNGGLTLLNSNTYDYRLENGAHVQVSVRPTGFREVTATAVVIKGNVTKLSLSNDYGLATQIRYVNGEDALAYPVPNDGPFLMGDFYPVQGSSVLMSGNGITMYQRTTEVIEGWMEVRRHPWLPEHTGPNHNWFERVHLTRAGGGDWVFGYSIPTVLPGVSTD